MNLERRYMIEELKKRPCKVLFTKVDGTNREMMCSLEERYLEEKEETGKEYSKDVIRVWSIDDYGWRSFRVDSVISFT